MPSSRFPSSSLRPLRPAVAALLAVVSLGLGSAGAWAQSAVYRCPGNTFTNALTAEQAQARGCKPIEGGSVTVVHGTSVQRRAGGSNAAAAPAAGTSTAVASADRPAERVSAQDQKARDSDAKRILQNELRSEQDRLSEMLKSYNNGEPERQGDERNYQKYLDRVAEMKAAISRKEADIAALKRELVKLGS